MMPGHIAQVKVYNGGTLYAAGERVDDYTGPLDWKYRPVDAAALSQWRERFEDTNRVQDMLRLQGADLGELSQPSSSLGETVA